MTANILTLLGLVWCVAGVAAYSLIKVASQADAADEMAANH